VSRISGPPRDFATGCIGTVPLPRPPALPVSPITEQVRAERRHRRRAWIGGDWMACDVFGPSAQLVRGLQWTRGGLTGLKRKLVQFAPPSAFRPIL
jgi:hypothetical protein